MRSAAAALVQAGQVVEAGGGSTGGGAAHLALEFRVFLVNTSTGKHAQVGSFLSRFPFDVVVSWSIRYF